VLGSFTVGDGARIASNAVVLKEVPTGATVVGAPGRVIRIHGVKVTDPLDHTHIPDPVANELNELKRRIAELEKT